MIKIPPQDIFLPCQVFLRAPWCWSDSLSPTHPGSNLILALSTKTLGWDSFFRKYAQKTTRCTGCPKKTHFENHQADPRLLGACKPGSLGANFLENFGQKSDLNGLCGAFFWDTLYTSHWTCLACLHQMYILDKSWTNMRFALVPILEGERGGGERWRVRDHLAQVAQVVNLALLRIFALLVKLAILVNFTWHFLLSWHFLPTWHSFWTWDFLSTSHNLPRCSFSGSASTPARWSTPAVSMFPFRPRLKAEQTPGDENEPDQWSGDQVISDQGRW